MAKSFNADFQCFLKEQIQTICQNYEMMETPLVVQWLRFRALNAEVRELDPTCCS